MGSWASFSYIMPYNYSVNIVLIIIMLITFEHKQTCDMYVCTHM